MDPREGGAALPVYSCVRQRLFVIVGRARFVFFRQPPMSIRAQRGLAESPASPLACAVPRSGRFRLSKSLVGDLC